jgi:hypothetical protein
MKKMILMVAVLLSSVAIYAQHAIGTISLKPEVGVNISNYRGSDSEGSEARLGLVAGAELEYQLSPKVSFTGGLLYAMEGSNVESADYSLRTEYVNIPLLVNVYLAKGFAVKAGIQPAFLTSAKLHGKANGLNVDVDFKDAYNSFDFAIPIGASYDINNFVIDARYNLSLTKATKDNFNFNGQSIYGSNDLYNSVFQITVGYKFDL